MAAIQKFRNKFKRSSSTNVTKISIPSEIPSRQNKSLDVLERLSVFEKVGSSSNFDDRRVLSHEDLDLEPICHLSLKTKQLQSVDDSSILAVLTKQYETMKVEKNSLKQQLQNNIEELRQRDEKIEKLQLSLIQMQQERQSVTKCECQISPPLNKQYIHNVEAELEKTKKELAQLNIDTEKKILKSKKKVCKLKQDFALRLFELKEENARLTADLDKTDYPESTIIDGSNFDHPQSQTMKNELVVQLSEQISQLLDENLKLRDSLKEMKRDF